MIAREPEFSFALIAGHIGEAAALRLAHDFGGTQKYVPRPENLSDRHPLSQSIGLAKAREFCERFGPGHVEVPLGPSATAARQRRLIERLVAEGHSNNAIARAARCTRQTVKVHRRRLRAKRQPDLFDRDARPWRA